ncbi:hypothetical protein BS47DRAFT_1387776 [Hydnum rufescens UP504]|uniref:Uncharacterized protein n=1 Tax=Hydnum rufescens UP504 TaxID=1448309 RepID=A0A9P6BAB9_9AGAM|nr:hypothetical protein BS47DRAFT_1387776 [Hydnum rufescens UP504]
MTAASVPHAKRYMTFVLSKTEHIYFAGHGSGSCDHKSNTEVSLPPKIAMASEGDLSSSKKFVGQIFPNVATKQIAPRPVPEILKIGIHAHFFYRFGVYDQLQVTVPPSLDVGQPIPSGGRYRVLTLGCPRIFLVDTGAYSTIDHRYQGPEVSI